MTRNQLRTQTASALFVQFMCAIEKDEIPSEQLGREAELAMRKAINLAKAFHDRAEINFPLLNEIGSVQRSDNFNDGFEETEPDEPKGADKDDDSAILDQVKKGGKSPAKSPTKSPAKTK